MDCPVSRYNRYIIPLFPLSKPHQFFIPLMVEPSSFSSSSNNSRGKKETARQPGREHLNLRERRKGKWNGREGSLNHRVRSRSYSSRTRRERERERESILTRSLFNFHVMAEAGLELPVVQFARNSSPTAILSFSVSIVGSVFGASGNTMIIKSWLKAFWRSKKGRKKLRHSLFFSKKYWSSQLYWVGN